MKITSKISLLVLVLVNLFSVTMFAQPASQGGDSSGGGGVAVPVTSVGNNGTSVADAFVPPDLSMLTNHADLVSFELKKVCGVLVKVTASASTTSAENSSFYPYTNSVKTLEDIMGMVTNTWYGMKVVDESAPLSISVWFYNNSDEYTVRGIPEGKDAGSDGAKRLFEGYNGGQPIRNQYNQLVLPDYAQQISMRMVNDVFIPATNIASAHLVYTNADGSWSSMDMPISYRQGFWASQDFAGQGIVVLGFWVYDSTNGSYSYSEHAYSLYNGGTEVQMSWVLARAILQDSEDFRTSVDETNLIYSLYSWNGFGKVPLLTPTYTRATNVVNLSVYSAPWIANATSFKIENLETGVKRTVDVPANATSVTTIIGRGKYHIVPVGIKLKPWSQNVSYGKGYG